MDGNAATQEIRALQRDGKAGFSHILGVSANVRDAQTKGMREAGMDEVISKPFKVDDLVKRIHGMISDNGEGQKKMDENDYKEGKEEGVDDQEEKRIEEKQSRDDQMQKVILAIRKGGAQGKREEPQ